MKTKLNVIVAKLVIGLLLIPIGLTLKMLAFDNLTTNQFLWMGSLLVVAVYVNLMLFDIIRQKTTSLNFNTQAVKLREEDNEIITRQSEEIQSLQIRLGKYMNENQQLMVENYQLKNPEKMSEELIFKRLTELANLLGDGYSPEMSCARCEEVFTDYRQLREHILECQYKDDPIEQNRIRRSHKLLG